MSRREDRVHFLHRVEAVFNERFFGDEPALDWIEDMYDIRCDIAHGRGSSCLGRIPPLEEVYRRVCLLLDE